MDIMENYTPLSLEYLDQIAPKNTKPPLPKGLSIGLIIFAGLALLIALSFMMMGGRGSAPNEYIIQRATTIHEVSRRSHKELRDTDIRAANSVLTTIAGDTVAKVGKANTGKKNKTAAATEERENIAKLQDTLEEARLNASYDRVFAREMSYQMDTLQGFLKSEYSRTSNSEKQAELESIYEKFKSVNDQFMQYQAGS